MMKPIAAMMTVLLCLMWTSLPADEPQDVETELEQAPVEAIDEGNTANPAEEGEAADPSPRAKAEERPGERKPRKSESSADELIGEMLKPPPPASGRPLPTPDEPPAVDRTSGRGAVHPDAPPVTVMREGTFLVDRIGRLTRGEDGQAEFAFESDGRALQDPPVVILPNLKLMAMEDAARAASRDLRFRITGVVTEYRGRNYVLLEKVVVAPDVTQQYRRTQQP